MQCIQWTNFGSSMELNPNAPAWTPGLCSSGERSGDSPDRNGRAAHCVGMHHKREEGVESDGGGWLNLPVNQDKHRADKFSQGVRTRRDHYRLLRRTHHRLLLRVIGYRRERGTYRQLSYAKA